ncbi:MAG: efflux RND transporter permease subunit [Patescibacteria group bacterium]
MLFLIQRSVFTYFALVCLLLYGVYSVMIIGKESSPEINVPIVSVTTVFPGAAAADVEDLVTDVIEDELLQALDDVDTIDSVSSQGLSVITVHFESYVDLSTAIQDVKDEVDLIESDLPDDAEDPIVDEVNYSDAPVYIVSVSTRSALTQLSETVAQIEDRLDSIQGVSEVTISGQPDRQINVIVGTAQMDQFNLNASDIVAALDSADSSLPVGSIVQSGTEYNITFDGELNSVELIENSVVARTQTGQAIFVRDIARVEDGLAERESSSRLSVAGSEPQQAITFSINKQSGYDVTTLTADVRAELLLLETELASEQLEFVTLEDGGEDVTEDLIDLAVTAMQTITLVFVVLLIGLGSRQAILAAAAVPISFIISFVGLYYTGTTLNFVSLFALVLVVGMLVDSAVVMVEGMTGELKKGLKGYDAAKSTISIYSASVTAGTLTTISIFAPMLFLSGAVGEFITSIPATVIVVMTVSLIIAIIYIPLFGISFLRITPVIPGTFGEKREQFVKAMNAWYREKLEYILAHNAVARGFVAVIILLFVAAISLVTTGAVKVMFFPEDDFSQFNVQVDMPTGTLLEQTERATEPVETIIQSHPRVTAFVSEITAEEADITVVIDDETLGDSVVRELRATIGELASVADVTVVPPASGVSTGAPFQVKFVGDDLEALTTVANEATALVKTIPDTFDVTNSLAGAGIDIILEANRETIEETGITVDQLAGTVRSALFGADAYSYTHPKSNDDVDVSVRVGLNAETFVTDDTNAITIDTLRGLPITTPNGTVLLGSLITESLEASNTSIEHEDGQRVITVSSYIAEDVVVNDINDRYTALAAAALTLPDGVTMKFGGDTEDSADSTADLGIALLVGVFLIMVVLVFQFNSIKSMLFIVSVIPLGLIGVLFGLAAFGQPLSFTGMLGFVALVGIVINNSIMLISSMNDAKATGTTSHLNVVLDSSVGRLRPILLTTATTVIGMMPLLNSSPMWAPLALAIIFGLLFAVVLTLVMIPIFYNWWATQS